jgi:thioredoxin reductase (NADPH)
MPHYPKREVLADKGVDGTRVRDNEASSEEVVACSGVFVFVGLKPNAGLVAAAERAATGCED